MPPAGESAVSVSNRAEKEKPNVRPDPANGTFVPCLLDVLVPSAGVTFTLIEYMSPFSMTLLSMVNTQCLSLISAENMDSFWMRFYANRYFIDPRFARQELSLQPREVFVKLMSLNISGRWHVKGTALQGGDDGFAPYHYEYIQRFRQTKGHAALHSNITGDVEFLPPTADSEHFFVQGKIDGNTILMNESIKQTQAPLAPPVAVNICSAIVSLDGTKMSGIWTQHHPSDDSVLGPVLSSGEFEATRVKEDDEF